MIDPSANPQPPDSAAPAPVTPPDRPHGLDPRALFQAVAAPTEGPGAGASALPDPSELAESFPHLEIGECLGRGGMGVVYKARQRSLGRTVALKLLAPERGHDPAFAARFAREAQALAKLSHPNIVTIHDSGQAGGYCFLLMEFVDGVNLRQAMQAGRFTPDQALAIVPPVCEALQYAHSRGLVHRDIKPENLLLDKEGQVKIADFGIAKMLDAEDPDPTGMTESQPAGTPRYMAPEQRDAARRTDHRADIYSLGVVLYELLTGEAPGERFVPPSRRVQIDVRLDEIVLRALEAEPDRRYQTVVELRTHIEEVRTSAASTSSSSRLASEGGSIQSPAAAGLAIPTPPSPVPHETAVPPRTPPEVRRAGTATVTTPDALATAAGQIFYYRNNRHQMVLDDERLTITGGQEATLIPLAAIRDLSLGRFPRTVNPAGLDCISLTYSHGTGQRQLILAPFESMLGTPSQWNAHVQSWWSAILDATQDATGRAPATTPAGQLRLPGSSPALVAALLVPLAIGLTLALFALDKASAVVIERPHPPGHPGLGALMLLILAALSPVFGTHTWSTKSTSWVGPALGIAVIVFAFLRLIGHPGALEFVLIAALAGAAMYWLKRSSDARASGRVVPPPPPSRWLIGTVYGLALILTVLFAAPHRSLLGAGNVETWTVGLPAPWIFDIKHTFANGTGQRIRDMHLDRASFYCGFGALAAWMLWIRLQTRAGGSAVFEMVAPSATPGGRPQVRFGRLAVLWPAVASLSVIFLLLTCVFMRSLLGGFPAPMPLLVFAVVPVSLMMLNGLRVGLSRRQPPGKSSDTPAQTTPARSEPALPPQ